MRWSERRIPTMTRLKEGSPTLWANVYVTACQSVPLVRSRDSFRLRPKAYVTAGKSVPFIPGDARCRPPSFSFVSLGGSR